MEFKNDVLLAIIATLLLIVCLFLVHELNEQKKNCEVLYDGGNFMIVSHNGTEYIINFDIDGGIHELKRTTVSENQTSN